MLLNDYFALTTLLWGMRAFSAPSMHLIPRDDSIVASHYERGFQQGLQQCPLQKRPVQSEEVKPRKQPSQDRDGVLNNKNTKPNSLSIRPRANDPDPADIFPSGQDAPKAYRDLSPQYRNYLFGLSVGWCMCELRNEVCLCFLYL